MSHLSYYSDHLLLVAGAALVTFAVAGVVYAYVGYPLLLWLIAKTVPRRPSVPATDLGLTLIIAAHNEEAGIREKLDATLRLNYPRENLQIIVASDGSTDNTDEIVREFRDRGVELIEVRDRMGKTNAQNKAVLHARHPILVFSDATTRYDVDSLQYLAGAYLGPRVGAVSGRYDYFDSTGGSPAGTGSTKFWNLENWIKRAQSRVHTLSGCCGCIYSVRRDLYTALSPETISDLVQPLHVILQGHRVVFEERAHASEEATRTAGDEFRMRVRVATRGMMGLLSVPQLLLPWKYPWIAFQLWSHKISRWSIPLLLACLFVGSLFLAPRPEFLMLLFIQLLFYGWALASLVIPGLRHSRILSLPLYFCIINMAFLLGIVHAVRGRQFNVWQPVRG
jgi:cellulose synthase/poly-beta-1,6-N-acetylglucosamine synthase-like glycosyltransferase